MSDLQSKIDALPPWPGDARNVYGMREMAYYTALPAAALARLALAREWIEATRHSPGCSQNRPMPFGAKAR